jgi:hypothetical protein
VVAECLSVPRRGGSRCSLRLQSHELAQAPSLARACMRAYDEKALIMSVRDGRGHGRAKAPTVHS